MTLLAYADVGTGSSVVSTASERVLNTLSFTVPTGGGIIRVDAQWYLLPSAPTQRDLTLHLSDDNFATVIDTDDNVGHAAALMPLRARTSDGVSYHHVTAHTLVNLTAGNWKVQTYKKTADQVTFASNLQKFIVTHVGDYVS